MEKTPNKYKSHLYSISRTYILPFLSCFTITAVLFFVVQFSVKANKMPTSLSIVLSPHFDDAMLSLGGFISQQQNPVIVATFFTGKPLQTVESGWDKLSGFKSSDEAVYARFNENIKALRQASAYQLNLSYLDYQYRRDRTTSTSEEIVQSIKKDIETILSEFSNLENISIYGPSEFGPVITHPDHQILHDAFVEIIKEKLAEKNLHFFFYEDFPYVRRHNAENSTSLKSLLEMQNPKLSISELPIFITPYALEKKINSISSYPSQFKAFYKQGANIEVLAEIFTKNRCSKQACEVVYEIRRAGS